MKDRGTYELEFHPRIDGEPCPYVVVEGPLAKRLAGLSLIRQDILAVREILSRLDPQSNDSVGNRALLFGALALYGKCFTQADGRGVKLDPKAIFDSTDDRSSHDRLMRLRHEYVAHGGNAQEEQLKIVLVLDPDKSERRLRELVGHGAAAHGLDEQAREECLATVDLVRTHVEESLSKAQEALWKAVQDAGEDWAYENAIWPTS